MIGSSAGLTFLYDGGLGIPCGSWAWVSAIAACTSCAPASMLRVRLNCSVMLVEPWMLLEVIESRPAIVENCFSSGVATEDAIVSGLAPGSDALTTMVGKSTLGRLLTGRYLYAIRPNSTIASELSVVMTGRRIKISEMFMMTRRCWSIRF